MPMPRHDKYDATIAQLAAEYPRGADVWRQFRDLAEENGWHDIPAERTVKRRVESLHQLSREDLELHARFRWPQSMLTGVVPWEASRAALDLLRVRDEMGYRRPTNG